QVLAADAAMMAARRAERPAQQTPQPDQNQYGQNDDDESDQYGGPGLPATDAHQHVTRIGGDPVPAESGECRDDHQQQNPAPEFHVVVLAGAGAAEAAGAGACDVDVARLGTAVELAGAAALRTS